MIVGLPPISFLDGVSPRCVLGKHPKERFEKAKARRASSLLELVHKDITSPFPHLSMNKSRYVLTFIDDFLRYTWVYFQKHKDGVFVCLQDFKALAEKQFGKGINIFHTDNGGVCK